MEIGNNPTADLARISLQGVDNNDVTSQKPVAQQQTEESSAVKVSDATAEIVRAVEEIAAVQSAPQAVVEDEDVIVALAEAASAISSSVSDDPDHIDEISTTQATGVAPPPSEEEEQEEVEAPSVVNVDTATEALGNTVDESV